MTVSLKHTFTSAIPDVGDATLVEPSDWNAEHTLSMATGKMLGRTTASTGAFEEITVTSPLALSALALSMPVATGSVNGYLSSTDWTTFNAKGLGTVTSVGFTGGLISVATATTTPALTVAGTSGGIPYFSSASIWGSSAALAANGVVIGGGAGAAPTTVALGTSGQLLTSNGAGVAPTFQTLTVSGYVPNGTQTGTSAQAHGLNSVASGTNATAIADTSNATGTKTTAVGAYSGATASEATALGHFSNAAGISSTAIGENSKGSDTNSTAIGGSANANAENSTAIGFAANSTGAQATTLGSGSLGNGIASTAIGYLANATGITTTAIGAGSVASGTDATAIGETTRALGATTVALGGNVVANGNRACAVGGDANSTADFATSIGYQAKTTYANSTSIGAGALATAVNQVRLGTASETASIPGALNVVGKTTPRMSSAASASTLTPNADNFDNYAFTALAAACTINADAGTPLDGQRIMIRFLDNATARALTWTTGSSKAFRAVGITLPTTTTISKTLYVGGIYNTNAARWDMIATGVEA